MPRRFAGFGVDVNTVYEQTFSLTEMAQLLSRLFEANC